jgi:hypothetical protein
VSFSDGRTDTGFVEVDFYIITDFLIRLYITLMILAGICLWLLRFEVMKKYLAAYGFLTNLVFGPACALAEFSLAFDDSLFLLSRAPFFVFLGFALLMGYHIILVGVAVKKRDHTIRERYLNWMVNFLGPITFLGLAMGEHFDPGSPYLSWDSGCMLMGLFYFIGFFQFPRVSHYWTKSQAKGSDQTVAGAKAHEQPNRIQRKNVRWRKK